MKKREITNEKTLVKYALEFGFLPFFKNAIPGFSVEEMCPPGLWFTDQPGPWEWKGPVIRGGECAYGKFFKNKAVYVSLEMLPHLCNYRRDGYDFDARCDDGLVYYRDKEIYDVISGAGRIISKDLRTKLKEDGNIDKYITRLQMQTYIVTADFVYEKSKNGKEYGWGVAEYAAPELLYGEKLVRSEYKTKPADSLMIMAERIQKFFPADINAIIKLIK